MRAANARLELLDDDPAGGGVSRGTALTSLTFALPVRSEPSVPACRALDLANTAIGTRLGYEPVPDLLQADSNTYVCRVLAG